MKYLFTILIVLLSVFIYGQSSPKITVSPTGNMMINSGTVTTTNVVLESISTDFSSLISDGTIAGTVHYKRHTASVGPIGTNDLISAPVTGQTFGTFATANNTNLASNPNNTSEKAFAPFVNTGSPPGAYVNYFVGTNDSETLDAGTGYRAATTDGSTLMFTGLVNTNDLLVSITDDTGSAWNLIGNPFPSYINFETFYDANKAQLDLGEFQAIYGYDGDDTNGSVWTIWNNLNTTDKISPGQGFFVRAKAGAGTIPDDTQVSFTTAMRTTGNSDDFIIGRAALLDIALARITLITVSNYYQTDIYFTDECTRGLDPGYDAGAMFGNAGGIFTLLVEDNTGVEMAIQALPYNDFNDVVIPLGIKSDAGEQISFGLSEDSTIPANINVYLEDNLANTFSLLNTGEHTVTPSVALDGAGRFFLHFSSTALSVDEVVHNGLQIYTTLSPKALFIIGQLNERANAELYDIMGRRVMNTILDTNNNKNEIDISAMSSGIYIVKVNNGDRTKSRKVFLN